MQALRSILRDRRFWAGLIGLGLVLGVAGPFGTVISLTLPERIAYWMFMVFLTGPAGLICSRFFGAGLRRLGLPNLPASILSGALTGLPINILVHGANALLLQPTDVALDPWTLSISLVGISTAISFAVALAFHRGEPTPVIRPEIADTTAPPALPRLVERLPEDLRAPLVAIDGIDHYTLVTTTSGSHRLLLRLSDAIAEADPAPGLRIHRSHWVALAEITATRRESLRGFVTSSDGIERPVSRSHLAKADAAGLFRS